MKNGGLPEGLSGPPAHEVGAEKEGRGYQDDGRTGRHGVEIGQAQPEQAGKEGKYQGKGQIAPHAPGDVAGRGGGQDEHGVDEKEPHPLDGKHDHHRDHHDEEVVEQADGQTLAPSQGGADAHGVELIEAEQPKHCHHAESDPRSWPDEIERMSPMRRL